MAYESEAHMLGSWAIKLYIPSRASLSWGAPQMQSLKTCRLWHNLVSLARINRPPSLPEYLHTPEKSEFELHTIWAGEAEDFRTSSWSNLKGFQWYDAQYKDKASCICWLYSNTLIAWYLIASFDGLIIFWNPLLKLTPRVQEYLYPILHSVCCNTPNFKCPKPSFLLLPRPDWPLEKKLGLNPNMVLFQ